MKNWKEHITQGNQYFLNQDYEAARLEYENARVLAEQTFVEPGEPSEAVFAVIVTYHNLADLYQKQGYTKMARLALETVHHQVLRAVAATSVHSTRHAALYRGAKLTYAALMNHKRCHLLPSSQRVELSRAEK